MIKYLLIAIIFISGLTVFAQTPPACENDVLNSFEVSNSICLFNKPLLVGASITKGYKANSGGASSIIANNLSPGAKINNIAKSGISSAISLENHTLPIELPSIVMGLDLFFWDAANNKCGEIFVKKTKSFMKLYQDQKIPMILGKLPKRINSPSGYNILNNNDCTNKINSLLETECTIDKNCLLYDPNECLSVMEKSKEYFVDHLHTTVEGNKYCANIFISNKNYQKLECKTN